jgi:hypothetical protein
LARAKIDGYDLTAIESPSRRRDRKPIDLVDHRPDHYRHGSPNKQGSCEATDRPWAGRKIKLTKQHCRWPEIPISGPDEVLAFSAAPWKKVKKRVAMANAFP